VGYTHTAAGIARVVNHAEVAEKERLAANRTRLGPGTHLLAAVAPHDDYLYAQRVYVHALQHLRARHVILVGVAHRARKFPGCEGKLVFEAFPAWHGPYGSVPPSPLREDLIRSLPPEDVLVSNAIHAGEHSLEGLVPFLQHYNREVEIVPILVPWMSWPRLLDLAKKTAGALGRALQSRGLAPGEDVAILISSDSVHYGDVGWGGRCFADFGTDGVGYDRAVARDRALIADHLTGEISAKDLEAFYRKVNAEDFRQARISWCGRFSIPFGLATLDYLVRDLGRAPARGDLLRYGTTLDPGQSDPGVKGLGVTAGANLHHWVGFASIGYR